MVVWALALVSPVLIYNFLTSRVPSTLETFKEAQHLLARFRIPPSRATWNVGSMASLVPKLPGYCWPSFWFAGIGSFRSCCCSLFCRSC